MLVGLPTGFAYPELYRDSAGDVFYVLGLELLQVGVAVLCFGLIRPWGEVVPGWVPGLRGRTIPRAVPAAIGIAGLVVLTAMLTAVLLAFQEVASGEREGWHPTDGMSSAELALFYACYVPFFLWPVAIAVAIAGYWLRRSPR